MINKIYNKFFVIIFWKVVGLIFKTRHKYNYVGLENIPKSGSVLLLGNHVSWIDWIIIQLPIKRQVSFLMDKDIYNKKFINYVMKKGDVIPLSARASKDAFKEAGKRLNDGRVVALYPEGSISKDGELGKFYKGYEKISHDSDGVIVPFFIDGVFGSVFSKHKSNKIRNIFKRRVINIYFSSAVCKDTKADELREIIAIMKEKYESK